jgi:N-acetylmuramoyl-L-alanine amidase
MRALRFAVVTALLAGAALPAEGARADRTSYERVLAREREVAARSSQGEASETDLRKLSVGFENIARRYPTSGYADDALLRAATVAEQLHQRFRREADAKRAALLYRWLAKEYPGSPHVKQAQAAAKAIEAAPRAAPTAPAAAKPPTAAPAKTTPAPATVTERSAPAPIATAGGADHSPSAPTGTGPVPAGTQRLREVKRTVLADLVRVTLELDGEVAYQHERIEGPPRLFFDLKGVQAAPALQDAVLTWPDDVVRQVRMGRKPQNTTRVVLDLDGVSRYSVFTLYNPYRVVVDLERQPGKRTGVVPRVPSPVVQVDRAASDPAAGASLPDLFPVSAAAKVLTPEGSRQPAVEPGSSEDEIQPVSEYLRQPADQSIASREIDLGPVGTPDAPGPRAAAAGGTARAAAPSPPPPKGTAKPPTTNSRTAKASPPLPTPPAAPESAAKASQRADEPLAPMSASTPPVSYVADTGTGTASSEVDLSSSGGPAVPANVAPKAPQANASGGFSLARQLGLGISRIVIDPGHGGHDPGALGKHLNEAELVLDVAQRLEKLLLKQAGIEVVLTRRTDTFVPLEERTAIANRQQADLFLSIHANASRNAKARGVETYFLNFASNPEAEAVAARENSASAKTMHNLPDIVRAIALNTKLDESRDFAHMVQDALVKRLSGQNRQLRNLGVKQAPFVVLIGAAMPSVLAEISFLTHPQEGQLLRSNGYRQRVAEALYDAVLRYQRSLKSVATVAQQSPQ